MAEIFWGLVAIVVLLFLAAWMNESSHTDCLAKGGQIIERPGELIDTCLLPSGARP